MIDIAELWTGITRKLRQDVGTIVIVDALQLYTSEQLVLVAQVVIQPAGIVVLFAVNRRVEDETISVQAITKRRVITDRVARIHKCEKVGVRTDSQGVESLQLRRRGGLHISVRIDIVQLAGTQRSAGND